MATLRNGAPVDVAGYFDKQGRTRCFPRYLRLCDVVLSNSHDHSKEPSWQVSVLTHAMVAGPHAREFLIQLPKRVVSYYARSDEQFSEWLRALERARKRTIERYYRLGRELGRGAFSTVRFGEDRITTELFAVKEIDKSKTCAPRFEFGVREVDIMLRLSHPNIINTHDIFENVSHLYLVIEYMQGGELFDIIADQGSLTEQRASQVIRDIITAVGYLHSHGIVHCDIKPENILCRTKTWPLHVKLADFGLAGVVGPGDNSLTAMIGTPGYCAPEVVKKKEYGPAVDMWAVGVILYILLSGRMPFYGRSDVETLRRTANGQYSFPPREWANISDDAKSLVRGLLQLNPAKRLTAEGALHHSFLTHADALSDKPIENDLSGLHSRLRKFRKAARAALLVERMKELINTSARARAAANENAGGSNASSPMALPANTDVTPAITNAVPPAAVAAAAAAAAAATATAATAPPAAPASGTH